ncbi:hypothetical protein WKK05_27755 [Nostoc sp. UHCC 0302]|uniref:hypothetical protein n=1 Tax=Nostoc sp. UHCC 0302 TaxID=3134896 RepID=UPI00311CAFA6
MVAIWEDNSSFSSLANTKNIYFYNLIIDSLESANDIFHKYKFQPNISDITGEVFCIKNKAGTKFQNACFITTDQNRNNYYSYPTIVNITATKLDISQIEETGKFVINRIGDITQALTVKYSIWGTAENGVDYQPIPNFVTIPAEASEAVILIQPEKSQQHYGLKTVLLSLENFAKSTQYMLGKNFYAVINILGY